MVQDILESTDAELVEAARSGDVSSFGELYHRHYAMAVGIAYCAVSDHHLAEDAAQEAFAVACRDLGRLRRADRFANWLGSICRKVALRAAKSKMTDRLRDEVATGAEVSDLDERCELVRRSVSRLPQFAREVIVLYYYSRQSHKQIAAVLGISPSAVHGRLIRARKKIAADIRLDDLSRSEP